jgi:hypothetical protein
LFRCVIRFTGGCGSGCIIAHDLRQSVVKCFRVMKCVNVCSTQSISLSANLPTVTTVLNVSNPALLFSSVRSRIVNFSTIVTPDDLDFITMFIPALSGIWQNLPVSENDKF